THITGVTASPPSVRRRECDPLENGEFALTTRASWLTSQPLVSSASPCGAGPYSAASPQGAKMAEVLSSPHTAAAESLPWRAHRPLLRRSSIFFWISLAFLLASTSSVSSALAVAAPKARTRALTRSRTSERDSRMRLVIRVFLRLPQL